jgi:hypothetical protein
VGVFRSQRGSTRSPQRRIVVVVGDGDDQETEVSNRPLSRGFKTSSLPQLLNGSPATRTLLLR